MRDAMRGEAKADPWRIRMLIISSIAGGAAYWAAGEGYLTPTAPVAAFYVIALVQSAMVLRPAEPAGAISRERQSNTFEPLFLTPLSPSRYLAGHLLYQLAVGVRRMAVSWPLFAAIYVLGGFRLGPFLGYQALLLAYGVPVNIAMMAMANAAAGAAAAAEATRGGGGAAGSGAGPGAAPSTGAAGVQGALARRLAARKAGVNMLANLNPVALPLYFGFAMLAIGFGTVVNGTGLPTLTALGTPGAPPRLDALKALSALHPFAALGLWGDILLFGFPVPVWAWCLAVWAVAAGSGWLVFTHQLTLRRFRPAPGFRVAQFVVAAGLALAPAAVLWRVPAMGSAVVFALTGLFALGRFLVPGATPVKDGERFSALPTRDILVHRSGNMLPMLVVCLAPAWLAQWALVQRAAWPGFGDTILMGNAMFALCVIQTLALGLAWRAGEEGRRLRGEAKLDRLAADARAAEAAGGTAATAADVQADLAAAKPGAKPARPPAAVQPVGKSAAPAALMAALWTFPLLISSAEPLASGTAGAKAAEIVAKVCEPLLLLSPLRYGYLAIKQTDHSGFPDSTTFTRTGPPALPTLAPGFAAPDAFESAVALAAVSAVVALIVHAAAAAWLARTRRETAAP